MHPALLASAAALLLAFFGPAAAQRCPVPAEADPVQEGLPAPRATGTAPLPAAIPKPRLSPEQVSSVPALAKLLAGGAEIYDLGVRHGQRGVLAVARAQDLFRVYYVTPDNEGLVEGWMVSTTAPPGERDVTVAQVRDIPGVVPTVDLRGAAAQPLRRPGTPAAAEASALARADKDGEAALAAVEGVAHGLVGRNGATRVWMVFDPLCPFSAAAMERLRPAIDTGRLQLALVPVPLLDPAGTGPNTRAALLLLSPSDRAMETDWAAVAADARARRPMPALQDFGPEARAALDLNRAVARRIGVRSSPTFLWRALDGGAPSADAGADGAERIAAALAP